MKALFLILGVVGIVAAIATAFGIFWCIGALHWLVINLYVRYMIRKPKVQDLCNKIAERDEGTLFENLSDWCQQDIQEAAINKVSRLPFHIPVDSYHSAKTTFFPYGILIAIILVLVGIVAVAGGGLLWHFVYGEPFIDCR